MLISPTWPRPVWRPVCHPECHPECQMTRHYTLQSGSGEDPGNNFQVLLVDRVRITSEGAAREGGGLGGACKRLQTRGLTGSLVGGHLWHSSCNSLCGATRYQVEISTNGVEWLLGEISNHFLYGVKSLQRPWRLYFCLRMGRFLVQSGQTIYFISYITDSSGLLESSGSRLALITSWVGSESVQLGRGWTVSQFSPSIATIAIIVTGKGALTLPQKSVKA